mmetsp:Transcript_58437/g.161696  ORF Transcript_58437/g.161696 Transcript_58437/m.161696 type:complete len:191 (-) Transcript_58437:94-666(-)
MTPVMTGGKMYGLVRTYLLGLKLWNKSGDDMAFFVEDDTRFIKNFPAELQKSIAELPAQWQLFHFGSGGLHGREEFPATEAFRLKHMDTIQGEPRKSVGGRAFLDWPKGVPGSWCCTEERGVLPGSPTAMIMKRQSMRLLQTFMEQASESPFSTKPIDVLLRNLALQHPHEHFIAAQPQLCTEMKSCLDC